MTGASGRVKSMGRMSGLALADLIMFNMGVLLGLVARFEGAIPLQYLRQYVGPLGLLQTAATGVAFAVSGLYGRIIRYSSIDDALALCKACGFSAIAFLGAIAILPSAKGFPRSVPFIATSASFLMSGGLRIAARIYLRRWNGQRSGPVRSKRVIVVGAGDGGSMVVKELKAPLRDEYELVGVVDDDANKVGLRLHGSPVLGEVSEIPRLISEHAIEEVIMAIPSANGSVTRRVLSLCEGTGVKVKTVPGLYEIINGNVRMGEIRDVEVEDLLGRDPVNLNTAEIAGYVSEKRVLVTGAGGSIGSELCRQLARFQPAQIIMLDHDENSVFELSHELRFRFPSLKCTIVVGDIRDINKMNSTFQQYRPDVVFHAAAHKHVPLMEEHPEQAVKTNVFGTLNVALAASRTGTSRFVLISTDKAVNPTSVMGATKAVAERIVVGLNNGWNPGNATKFMAVRFGNVLGSRGSVVPLFKEQIARGGPITVTHPDMKRYFMTIPEAVQLVIQAGAIGQGGEVFVLDMGDPVRIVDLAETLIRLSGLEPGRDIQVEFSGLRRGEKLFEEIFSDSEKYGKTSHSKIFVARDDVVEINGLRDRLAVMEKTVFGKGARDGVRSLLKEIVPAYNPWTTEVMASETAAAMDTAHLGHSTVHERKIVM